MIASVLFDLENKHSIRVVGHIERGLPSPRAPYWQLIQYAWAQCIPLSIVSYAITYSVGKSFAIKHDYEIDSSQELIALGGSNLFSSFFSCIPVGASLSRSAVQESSGGRTQLVSLVNCVGICAVLLYFGSLLEQLPDVRSFRQFNQLFLILVFKFIGSSRDYYICGFEDTITRS